MKRALASLAILLAAIPPAIAADNIDQINQLIQADFRKLSEDLGAALSYKAVIPAKPLGITGFDLGVEVSATKLQHRDAWDRASSGTTPDTVYIPKLHLHKGLPAGFDLGAFYTSVPDSNIKLWGAEARYAILQGGLAEPALGLRGTYSKLAGVSELDFRTSEGNHLEGHPIKSDRLVQLERSDLYAGRDPGLEAALAQLSRTK